MHADTAPADPRVCRHFVRGRCRLGAACSFIHRREEQAPAAGRRRRGPQRKWCASAFRNRCSFGEHGRACVYMHVEDWVQLDTDRRLRLSMPPMLRSCAETLSRVLHAVILDAYLESKFEYDEASQVFCGLGLGDALPDAEPHILTHACVQGIVSKMAGDLEDMSGSEGHVAGLAWLCDRVADSFVVGGSHSAAPAPAAPDPAKLPIVRGVVAAGFLPMPPHVPLARYASIKWQLICQGPPPLVTPTFPTLAHPAQQAAVFLLPPPQPTQPLPPGAG
eukprot:TRINITY_DN1769_c0_g2_i2.p2 TRINITY_DN1769_c0_g2~~TRINITY_DN1769_c0_g2_i2.p2  ORF type:complete len:292 (+),score=81.84 TRINITY_DN1769_c0_g2_i2:48-878(+)